MSANEIDSIKTQTSITPVPNKKGRVFIRNLPFKNLTEEKIKSLFSKFGEITEVNLPKKDTGEMRGFGFIQFSTKNDALIAIKEMNNTKLDNRKILVSLALSKEDYKNPDRNTFLEENKNDENKHDKVNSNNEENNKKNKKLNENTPEKSASKLNKDKNEEGDNKNLQKKALLNDPERTIFIRNLGFNTDEEQLKEFFNSMQGNVLYAKIVKDSQTKTSKGTGFVMFRNSEDVNLMMNLYHKYNNRNRSEESTSLNPFELEGRNLKLFNALSKQDANKMETENKNKKNIDSRNRHLIYYGLSVSNAKLFSPENQDISEEDKEKRETLIKMKKINFNSNPNYHVSETRLTLRNLDKNVDENKIKSVLSEKIEEVIKTLSSDEIKKYRKTKIIKQVKLLRDKNTIGKDNLPKSKCVAYVEVCDMNFAKNLINSLSNMKLNSKSKKGMIIDFALEDSRKLNTRKKKIEKIREVNKIKKKNEIEGVESLNEMNDDKNNNRKISSKSNTNDNADMDSTANANSNSNVNDNEINQLEKLINEENKSKNKTSINDITDINLLVQIYKNSISRGKKQRIKHKLRSLGYNEPLESSNVQKIELNSNSQYAKPLENKSNQNFVITKIENSKTNINKKITDNNKNKNLRNKSENKEMKNETTLLTKKRDRNEIKKEIQVKNVKLVKNEKLNIKDKKDKFSFKNEIYSDDSDDDEMDMNPYYAQILEKLNKNK